MRRVFGTWIIILSVFCLACNQQREQPAPKNAADSAKRYLETLNAGIAKDATNPGLYLARARFFLTDRQFDNALKDINHAISLDPKKPEYYTTLSDIYLLSGQTQNSTDALTRAITLNPSDKEALLKMARLCLIIKDYPGTFEYVKRNLAIDDFNPPAYFIRGIALLEKGDTNRAVTDFIKAVDQDQGYYEATIQLAELFALKKDPMTADYLKNALTIRPNDREALYMLGMFYQETGQYVKAIEVYKRLQKADTAFRNSSFNIGYIYLVYLKDFPQAIAFFSNAIKRDPVYYEAYFNRGYAEELTGAYKKAYADYQQALKINVNYPNAVDGLNRLDRIKITK